MHAIHACTKNVTCITDACAHTQGLHSMFPTHVTAGDARCLIGGPDCKKPYSASHLNVSAMSFGALSDNAVLALNSGAKLGGFYHNTGEGGMSKFHLVRTPALVLLCLWVPA